MILESNLAEIITESQNDLCGKSKEIMKLRLSGKYSKGMDKLTELICEIFENSDDLEDVLSTVEYNIDQLHRCRLAIFDINKLDS